MKSIPVRIFYKGTMTAEERTKSLNTYKADVAKKRQERYEAEKAKEKEAGVETTLEDFRDWSNWPSGQHVKDKGLQTGVGELKPGYTLRAKDPGDTTDIVKDGAVVYTTSAVTSKGGTFRGLKGELFTNRLELIRYTHKDEEIARSGVPEIPGSTKGAREYTAHLLRPGFGYDEEGNVLRLGGGTASNPTSTVPKGSTSTVSKDPNVTAVSGKLTSIYGGALSRFGVPEDDDSGHRGYKSGRVERFKKGRKFDEYFSRSFKARATPAPFRPKET